jgi:hypothetical protein
MDDDRKHYFGEVAALDDRCAHCGKTWAEVMGDDPQPCSREADQ